MRRLLVRILAISISTVIVTVAIAAGYRAWQQHANAQALAIATPHGVQEARFVRIGGIDQWVQIRGEDRGNPVLLILAGGPGNSLVPLTPVFQSWERCFTVVQWDQRERLAETASARRR